MTDCIPLDFSPHKYTSGRWLLRDDQQCQARHISFDFNKLCDRAIACSNGARDIVECVKVEGGFNRAFLLQLDNGASLVARVPFSIAGPARLTTNSEVATMEYSSSYFSSQDPVRFTDWYQSETTPPFLFLLYLTGAMTPIMRSERNTSSWKVPKVFSYTNDGRPWTRMSTCKLSKRSRR